MTLLERVDKKSTEDKNLAASARYKSSLLTDTEIGTSRNQKGHPLRELQPYGGKAQSQPPVSEEIVLPLSAESSTTMQQQKVKKWTPAFVRHSVSNMMETLNILTCDGGRDGFAAVPQTHRAPMARLDQPS